MRTHVAIAGALALIAAGCGAQDTGGVVGGDAPAPVRPSTTGAEQGGDVGGPTVTGGMGTPAAQENGLVATLAGKEEVPGPGDPDGAGAATLTVASDGKVCATMKVSQLDEPTAAHVHQGRAGLAGPVDFALPVPKGGATAGCVTATPDKASALLADPAAFYVNVHTGAFPDGAVRGQLARP